MTKKPMSDKTPAMREAIEAMFPGTESRIEANLCPVCGGPTSEFRTALSRREYEISGMCQACQDDVFGTDEEEDWYIVVEK